jgi:hypothetical protein
MHHNRSDGRIFTGEGDLLLHPAASGVVVGDGSAGDEYHLTFNGATSDGTIKWNDTNQYLEFDARLVPNASGAIDIGTESMPWASGWFDGIRLQEGVSAITHPNQAITKEYFETFGGQSPWKRVGTTVSTVNLGDTVIVDDDFIPDASGTGFVGTQQTTFGEGNFENLNVINTLETSDFVVPEASGTANVGTVATAYASGVFDNLQVNNIIIAGSEDVSIAGLKVEVFFTGSSDAASGSHRVLNVGSNQTGNF